MLKPEKAVILIQILRQNMGSLQTAKDFSSSPEKRGSTFQERQNRKSTLMFSETHTLRKKNLARQDTRESLTTQSCVAKKGVLA